MDAAGGVHQDQDYVAGFQGFVHFLEHAAVKVRAGLVDAGGVYEYDLGGGMLAFAGGNFEHSGNAVAGGLGLGGDDGYLFAGEGVEEGALSGVGPAENGDKSRFQKG